MASQVRQDTQNQGLLKQVKTSEVKIRQIKLRQDEASNGKLGFSLRGGKEAAGNSVGVFVCHVEKGSEAERSGLKLGDQLIQVNGKRVDQASYDQVIAWIRQTPTNEEISLHVKNSARIPVQEKSGDPIEWLEVETIRMQATDGPNFGTSSSGKSRSNMSHSSSGDEGIESCGSHRSGEWEDTKTGRNEDQVQIGIRGQSEVADRESVEMMNKQKVSVSSSQSGGSSICDTDSVSVSGLSGSSLESSAASSNFQFIPNIPETFIRVPGKRAARESHDESPFGCGVVRGPDEWPGLYVQTVRAKSLADRVGLEVGDQILEIQDKSIDGVPFETAVKLIKRLQAEQDELRLKVRKGAALRYLDYNRRLRMQTSVSQDRMTSNRCIQLGLGVNQAESVSKVEEHATDGLDSEDDLSPLGSPVENVSLDSKVSSSDANETSGKLMGQMNSISGIENQSSDKESRTLRLKERKELNFHNETVRISPVKLSLDGEPKPRKLLNGLNGARRVGESRESRFSYVSVEQKQASDRNQTDSRRHPGKETDIIIEYEEENQRDTNQLVWFGTKTTPRRDQEDEPIERHEMESPKIRIVSQNCKLHNHKQAAQRVKVANLLHELQPRSQLAQLAANHIEASSKTRPQRVRDTRDKPQVAICEPRNRIYAAVSSMRRPSQMMQRYVSMDNLLFNQTGLRCLKRNVRQPYEQIYACSSAFPPQNSLVMIASQTPPTPGVRKLDSGGYQATGACCAVGAHRLCSPAARNSNPVRRKQPNEAFVCHTITPNVPSPAVRLSKARSVDKLNVEALGCSMSLAASKNRVNYIRINQLDSSKSLKHLKSRSQLTPDSQRLQYESVPSPSTVCRSVGCQSDYHDPSELVYIQKSQNGTSCSICLAQAAALNPARVEKILHLRPNNLGLSGRNLISNGIRPEFYSQENRSKLSKPSKCNSSCCSLYSADEKVRLGELRYRDRSKPAELQVLRSPDMKISSQRERHLSTFMGVSNKSTRYQSAGSEELSPICTPPPLTSTSDESINCHSVSSNSSPSILSDCEPTEPPKRTYLRSRVAPSSSKRVEKSCRKPSPPCPPPPPARDLELERKSQRELRGSSETQEKETSKPNHRLCFVDELKILANQQKSSSSQPSKGSTSPELESSTLIKMINASKSTSSGWTKRVSSCAYCTKSNAGKLDGKLDGKPASNKANVLVDGGASSNKCSKCNKSQALVTPPLDSDPGKLKKEGEADKRRQHEMLMKEFKSVHSKMFSKRKSIGNPLEQTKGEELRDSPQTNYEL